MLIYKIESSDGRFYIGQTTLSLEKRILSYKADVKRYLNGKYKHNSRIIRAIAKYGLEQFKFSIIDYAFSQKELDCKEKFWISIYSSTVKGIGFNIQNGGFGVGKHSDETKLIMSEKKKGITPYNKGLKRILYGENIGTAKLTQLQANEIRSKYNLEKSIDKLAEEYSVSKPTILSILKNKSYFDVNFIPSYYWSVYMIQSLKDQSIYTGITKDVNKRLLSHNQGRGASYTRSRNPFILIWHTKCINKSEALKLEFRIKKLSHKEKILLSESENEIKN